MADTPSWLLMVTGLFITAVLAVGLFVRLRRARGEGDPSCGACGYLVRGLSTFTCPECGADLRDVGIVKTGGPAGGGPANGPIVAWVSMCWLGGMGMLFMLMNKGAPNGNIGQWLGITVLLTCGSATSGAWLISWRMRNASVAIARPRQPYQPLYKQLEQAEMEQGGAVSRTLSVMFIDMAGYTARTSQATRDGLVDLLRKTRELVEPSVRKRRGRIVKTMGDGFVITFDSATDAVLAGVEVQRETRGGASDGGGPGGSGGGVELRIGVSTGEVTLEKNDVYGVPVNLAARIQQLAEPGRVYFSESTWHAMTRSEVAHEEAGEFEVKGVEGKVRVFRVV